MGKEAFAIVIYVSPLINLFYPVFFTDDFLSLPPPSLSDFLALSIFHLLKATQKR